MKAHSPTLDHGTILGFCCKAVAIALALMLGPAFVAEGKPAAQAAFAPPANMDFEQPDPADAALPLGWRLSGGEGRWVEGELLEVTGRGEDSNYWRGNCRLVPGALYQFDMRARCTAGIGTVVAGPDFATRDYRLSEDWQWYSQVFRTPEHVRQTFLRIGQWHAKGTFQFDAVRLRPVVPVHRWIEGFVLGEGESLEPGHYTFTGTFGGPGSNYHRPLHYAAARFNSDRFVFYTGDEVTWAFALDRSRLGTFQQEESPVRFRSGRFNFNVNYYVRGACAAEVSYDRAQTWRPLARQAALGTAEVELPAEGLPAETVFVRLRAEGDTVLQVNRVEFHAAVEGDLPEEALGQTRFAVVTRPSRHLVIDRMLLLPRGMDDNVDDGTTRAGRMPHHGPVLWLTAHQRGSGDIGTWLTATVTDADGGHTELARAFAQLDAGRPAGFRVPLNAPKAGRNTIRLRLAGHGLDPLELELAYDVPDYYRADYGERLVACEAAAHTERQGGAAGRDSTAGRGSVALWWCDATHKIPRHRALPEAQGAAVRIEAARNDFEAAQLVVRPEEELKGLRVEAQPLRGPNGAVIGREQVRILRVYYHFVHTPTDRTGVRDWWPDALPPLDAPLDVPAAVNQPLWVLVHVPGDAPAGDYQGELRLEAEGFSATVPLKLHVWDFSLPVRNHLETAFGLSAGNIYRYHQLESEEQKRRVMDMYLECLSEHRIGPYHPAPLDPIRVRFVPDADPPRAELDFTAFDRAMQRAVEKFHFTNFMLQLQGMGGGSFHGRSEPRIGAFTEDTPEYQAMFSSYVGQLEEHLRAKGWLQMAYVYWFDEPAPKDYEFVRRGMERLKKHAPGIPTMLTEQPEPELAGPVDIWCPVSYNYDHQQANARRARGERFWWYVCCGPKAPYCTLFIDHPATELRVWLWQTWQRDISGILVWSTNYWTSRAAFPDPAHPQNPYEDPMGYVSGYSTPPGTKRYWGNGDGRFVYPPLSAALPGLSGPEPVVEPPVASIRLEMLREGIEDYEMLYLLRELLEKHGEKLTAQQRMSFEALLEVPPEITREMTVFTTDPAPICQRRRRVAEAIERLVVLGLVSKR